MRNVDSASYGLLAEILRMEASVMPRLPLLLTFFKPEASTTAADALRSTARISRLSALVAVRSDQRTEPPYFFKRKKGSL